MDIIFTPTRVIPVTNPFSFKGVPSDYLLACTSDSCFCQSVFDEVVKGFQSIAPTQEDVLLVNTILFVSPRLGNLVKENPQIAPVRY